MRSTLAAFVLMVAVALCAAGYGNRYSRSRYNSFPRNPPRRPPENWPPAQPPVQRPPFQHSPPPWAEPGLRCTGDGGGICEESCGRTGIFTKSDTRYSCDTIGTVCCMAP